MSLECNGTAAAALRGARAERRAAVEDRRTEERRSGRERRTLSARTLVRSGLTPRRRAGRRAGEQQGLVDWHEPHLLLLSIVILLLSVLDAFMTLTLLMRGTVEEANPLLRYVLSHHPNLFAAVKMTLTGGGLIVLVVLARARLFRRIRVSAILHWCLVGYVALIGYEWWLFQLTM